MTQGKIHPNGDKIKAIINLIADAVKGKNIETSDFVVACIGAAYTLSDDKMGMSDADLLRLCEYVMDAANGRMEGKTYYGT
jgi:hypothetical protein